MKSSRLFRRHSIQPLSALQDEVEPWGNDTPFLPLSLLAQEKSKIKSLPLRMKKHESSVQLQSHHLPLKEKPSTRVPQEMPKVNINLYNIKKVLRARLPELDREKTERAQLRLKLLRDSRQLQQELHIERKIFLMHNPERSAIRRSLM